MYQARRSSNEAARALGRAQGTGTGIDVFDTCRRL